MPFDYRELDGAMKVELHAGIVVVRVSARALDEFAKSWPASGLAGRRGVSIEFERRTGDLVAGSITRLEGKADSGAINAIIDDAKVLVRSRGLIPE